MPTKIFTYRSDPLKVVDTYRIANSASYTLEISQVRLVNGRLVANVACTNHNQIMIDFAFSSKDHHVQKKEDVDISKAVDNPVDFLNQFAPSDIKLSKLSFYIKVDHPAANAPQEVKDFYKNKLNEDAIKAMWASIEKELVARNSKEVKIEGEFKKSLTKRILKSFRSNKFNYVILPVIMGLLISALVFSPILVTMAYGFSVNAPLAVLLGLSTVVTAIMPFTIINLSLTSEKLQATALSKLGEFENETIETSAGLSHLVTKVAKLLEEDPNQVSTNTEMSTKAIEVGKKSCTSNFEQFKSFFNKDAYHYGYYIGKEMAARKESTKSAAKPQ